MKGAVMKKLYEVCLAAFVAFSAFAEDVSKAPEPDWDGICFAYYQKKN